MPDKLTGFMRFATIECLSRSSYLEEQMIITQYIILINVEFTYIV